MPQFIHLFNETTILINKTVEFIQHISILGLGLVLEATTTTCLRVGELLLFQFQNLEFKLSFIFF